MAPNSASDPLLVSLEGGGVLEPFPDLPDQRIARRGEIEGTTSLFSAGQGNVQWQVIAHSGRLVVGVANKLSTETHLGAA